MTAPALVVLVPGGRDPRPADDVETLVRELRRTRPDLRVEPAASGDSFEQVVARLAAAGLDEAVVVPLLIDDPVHHGLALEPLLEKVGTAHGVRLRAAAPLGHEPALLEVLDARLRDALAAARVRELDALVLAASGTSDPLANQSVARLARLWGSHHRLPVTAAYAASAPPATGEAVRAFRAEGRRHIAVGSLFLTPGVLADRAGELALEAGAVAVSPPLGTHAVVARLVLARYSVGAVELVPV